jgi:hypothetical protein
MEDGMTTSKIRIKWGSMEVEYEGSETFLKDEVPGLLGKLAELDGGQPADTAAGGSAVNPRKAKTGSGQLQATTANIAAKLSVGSGPELIIAAAARLTFVLGQDTFSRQQLIDEMKTAAAYHKASYVSNLSKSLASLVKDHKLNEPTQGNFALTATTRATVEPLLV